MRIDPKGAIAGHPGLTVRQALRRLQTYMYWREEHASTAAKLPGTEGAAFSDALVAAGLSEAKRPGEWAITQAGKRLASATAARPISRTTAERAYRDFLSRVDEVNRNDYYLGKVSAVVLFGSMLRPEVDHLSDVDVAVEIEPKEADPERGRAANEVHALELAQRGHHFRRSIDWAVCWYREVFGFLKGRSRVISLANLRAEGELILAVPHRIVYAEPGWTPFVPPPEVEVQRTPVPDDPNCPF